jgi:cyclophilin family peptidyl-prolyl cis-trans isomerase
MISMANLGPTHNTSMFFITLSEQKEKDGKFSVFGEVVGGY